MKTIGIVAGMSWESSAEYYRLINEQVKARLGAAHSAELVMYSLDFHAVAQMEPEDRWSELAVVLIEAAKRLERAGAEFILMASNTAHKVADAVQASIGIPLLHSNACTVIIGPPLFNLTLSPFGEVTGRAAL